MLGSEKWDTLRPLLQAGWQAEQQPPLGVAEDVMDVVQPTPSKARPW